jgi:hypothetical protein
MVRLPVELSTGVTLVLFKNSVPGCGIFNDADIISEYAASNDRMINELLGKEVKGSGRGLIQVLSQYILENPQSE